MYIDLSGEWNITLEADEGIQSGTIMLPGILQACGYGNPVTRETPWVSSLHDSFWYEQEEYKYGQENGVKVPFLAQPPRHFLGQAVYERKFVVPEPFGAPDSFVESEPIMETEPFKETESPVTEKRNVRTADSGEAEGGIFRKGESIGRTEGIRRDESICREWHFHIEAARWRSRVWVDGEFQGEDCSLCSPHDIRMNGLEPGLHTISVMIDNSMLYPYRPDAHSVSDALGGSWNGMVGEIALFTEDVYIERRRAREEYAGSHPRTVEAVKNRVLLDRKPFYFRATHFGGDFPLTGYPAADKGWWLKMMAVIKEWGLNGIRFHSYCPPEAAFAAADEAGICLLVECGMWNHFGEEASMYSLLKREAERILENFGHHPSFVFFSSSNEPGGAWYKPLRKWVSEIRKYDEDLGYGGRRIYTAQSGWFYDVPPAEIEGTDFIYFHRSGYGPYVGGTIRNPAGWRGGNYSPSLKGVKKPVFCHELGQICAYPDYSITEKFTGFLQPGNYEVFRENARANGVLPYVEEFVKCSGENQVRLYKEELEANFRTPEIQGFELLDLHDYLGQGTALVGILDPFWEGKGYGSPEKFRESCGDTVLLAGCSSYVWKSTDTAVIPVEVCHYGEEDIRGGVIRWKLRCEGRQRISKDTVSAVLQDEEYAAGCKNSAADRTLELRKTELVKGIGLQKGEVEADITCSEDREPPQEEQGMILQSGYLPVEEVLRGGNTKTGEIILCFDEIFSKDALKNDDVFPEGGLCCILKLELQMDIPGKEQAFVHNSWDLYVFRKPVLHSTAGMAASLWRDGFSEKADNVNFHSLAEYRNSKTENPAGKKEQILYTRNWPEAKAALEAGGKVVFSPYLSDLNYECPALSGRSVNWNGQMGPSWCRTMGVVIDEKHPIFRYFATGHSGGWQWEDILGHARGFHMEGLEHIRPIVQPIDDWNRNLLQGMIFEAGVLKGRLLLVSADLEGGFEERPAAFCLKQAILRYAASELFHPAAEADVAAIERKLFPMLRMEALTKEILYTDSGRKKDGCYDGNGGNGDRRDCTAQDNALEQQKNYGTRIINGENIVTADPGSSVRIEKAAFPVSVTIILQKSVEIQGILYVPEQRDRNHEGFAGDYLVEVRKGETGSWEKAAEGTFRNTCRSQSVLFDRKAAGDAVRLTVHSAYGCVDKFVWKETEKGWYRTFSPARAVVQIAGIHVICDETSPHSDSFMAGNQKSRTKEIEA